MFNNFFLNLASNTTNLIQYDNVCAIGIFAESRGYLSPEEPRDFSSNLINLFNLIKLKIIFFKLI